MEEQLLPGIEPEKDVLKRNNKVRKENKTYYCKKCSCPSRSVTWDNVRMVYVCWACGTVDRKHTREAGG